MNTERFTFPGFAPVRQADTSTHEVEVGRITLGDEVFIVHMIRKAGLSFEGNFLVAKVFDHAESKRLWEFPKYSFEGLGLLAQAGNEVVITLVSKGRDGKVEEVFPFSSIATHQPTNLRRKIELKRLAAEYLGKSYNLTNTERAVVKRDSERRREEEQTERERQHEARQQARMELIARITSRGRVEAYTSDGRKRYGLPVVGEEWQSLSGGTYVVLVESYDDTTGDMGNPIEAFEIVKEKGKNPKKGFPAPVTWRQSAENLQAVAVNIPQPAEVIVIETDDGDAFEVAVYASMDDIRTARERGLNSGSYVAARDRTVGERYEVFSVHAEKVKTLGLFKPIA